MSPEHPFLLPDSDLLQERLAATLDRAGFPACAPVTTRRINAHSSTYPSEVVTCRLADGTEIELFCKYGSLDVVSCHGHRGGTPSEIAVYERVLKGLPLSRCAFYGAHLDSSTGAAWLFIEYLKGAMKVSKCHNPQTLPRAAGWVGSFHRLVQSQMGREEWSFLKSYDAGYYQGWSNRLDKFAGTLHQDFPWLATVCRRFGEVFPLLLAAAPTVIHGEFVTANVLIRNQVIYPVDWESAAIAAGEIDLVMLMDGWDPETVRRCEEAYCQARWPQGAPDGFARRVEAAKLYTKLRWMGDRPEWTTHKNNRGLFGEIEAVSRKIGIIE